MAKKTHNRIYFLLFLLLLLGYVAYNLVTPKEVDVLSVQPKLQLKAEDLVAYFETQKNIKNKQYLEKVIEVDGVIKDINNLNNRHTILLEGSKNNGPLVICDMNADQQNLISKLKSGDHVFVKGIYKGFLEDVILLNCIIANKKTND